MSKRSDIIDGKIAARVPFGLVYTEVLGWSDLGHAQGKDIRTLLRKIEVGESSGQDRYDVSYSQSMIDPFHTMKMGKKIIYFQILKGFPMLNRVKADSLTLCRQSVHGMTFIQGLLPWSALMVHTLIKPKG